MRISDWSSDVCSSDLLGAQGTVLAGGRYDGLIEALGGPETPGVGWAAGIERLAMLIDAPQEEKPHVVLIPMGAAAEKAATGLLADQIGRAHVRTTVTNAHLVCRLPLEKKKKTPTQ